MNDFNDARRDAAADSRGNFHWYLRGAVAALSLPAFILASSFVGFAALALEAGVTMAQAIFMTAVVWALPSKVVLVGAIMAGNGLVAAAFAVALSAVRRRCAPPAPGNGFSTCCRTSSPSPPG